MENQDVKHEVTDKYSLRGRVFHRIREDILNGKYKDHEELKEVAIGQELGVERLLQIPFLFGKPREAVTVKSRHDMYSFQHRPVKRLLEAPHLFVKGVEVHDY